MLFQIYNCSKRFQVYKKTFHISQKDDYLQEIIDVRPVSKKERLRKKEMEACIDADMFLSTFKITWSLRTNVVMVDYIFHLLDILQYSSKMFGGIKTKANNNLKIIQV